MSRQSCGTCRFWTFTREQDSGIKQPDGLTQWFYRMGNCGLALDNAPTPGSRFGKYPTLGSPEDSETPEWSGCFYGKSARARMAS